MKQNLLSICALVAFLLVAGWQQVSAQGVTTSGMNGRVVDASGEALPGATILAVHQPTGSQFGNVSDVSGYYRIPNMNVGGPYKITVSFVGYENYEREGIYLTLGQTFKLNVTLSEGATELEEVVVSAGAGDIFDGNRTGAETVISEEQINTLPTVARDLSDFTRTTPQAAVTGGGGLSIAGMNNRFNAIYFDGAVNNDVFGLTDQGTNNGQSNVSPISIDAIEQFQVVLAPFDVRLGGFAGGGINVVTRSGTNNFEGSAYFLTRNESLAGKTPTDDENADRTKLAEFTAQTYGFRLGGPIIKDKLFFFVNGELQRNETPQPFDFNTYLGDASLAEINAFRDRLINQFGYDPGGFVDNTEETNSDKLLIKLDWNINERHKLMVRHSYTRGEFINPSRSNNTNINFFNAGRFFPSDVHSTTVELKSNFSNTVSNNLIIGVTTSRDDADPLGDNFPRLQIFDGDGTINAGSEVFRTANQLDTDVITVTNNLSLYKGRHTLTFGTHNEFYTVYNLFIRRNFGEYRWFSLEEFMNGDNADRYRRNYSLVDDVTGDGSAAAADFSAMQLGFYVQDEFEVNDNLKLTAGVRVDIPVFNDDPPVAPGFNETTIPTLEAAGWDLEGAQAGNMPSAQFLVSPRIGFNYDLKGDKTTQIRGGIGIFTTRIPFVWPAGSYTNNGVISGATTQFDVPFNSDWQNQPTAADFGEQDVIPSGQIDLFAEDFRFPQVLRTNIAIDQKLPWGLIGTVEFMYSKLFNNTFYQNVNLRPSTTRLTGTPDDRLLYQDVFTNPIDDTYEGIYLATNTDEGYSYNFTVQVQKPFTNGFAASAAYTFGRSESVFENTSSQNSSQWRGMHAINGRNFAQLGRSEFDVASRVIGSVSYRWQPVNAFALTGSLFYSGQSGAPFSYIYNDQGQVNGEDDRERNLIYVPRSADEIVLVQNGDMTPAQQWTALNNYIENDDYLSERRGRYAERNMSRTPFESIVDFRILADFYVTSGSTKHNLQVSFDIFNFGNFINKDWGRRYFNGSFGNVELLDFEGFLSDGTTPTFTFDGETEAQDFLNIDDSGINSSRWQAQLGVRYSF